MGRQAGNQRRKRCHLWNPASEGFRAVAWEESLNCYRRSDRGHRCRVALNRLVILARLPRAQRAAAPLNAAPLDTGDPLRNYKTLLRQRPESKGAALLPLPMNRLVSLDQRITVAPI